MSDADFYNRNLYRQYPFKDKPFALPSVGDMRWTRGVVDVGFVFLPSSGFDQANVAHKIYPRRATKFGGTARLSFYISASGTALDGRTVTAQGDDELYNVLSFPIYDSALREVGFGYAVLGDTSDFPPTSGIPSYNSVSSYVEPRCIQTLDGHFVNKVDVANEPRTTASGRCELSSSSASSPSGYTYAPGGRAVQGDLKFSEGYNTDIVVLASANAIRFSARRGAGLGEPCEEVPKTAEEQERADMGMTLDRAVRCNEVFSNINGVAPDSSGNFALIAARGVEITSPSPHRILISGRSDLEDCTTES